MGFKFTWHGVPNMDGVLQFVSAFQPSNAPLLITAVFVVAAGVLLYQSARGARTGSLFLQVTLFLGIYLAGRYFTLASGDPQLAFSWALVTSIGVLCVPIALYQYVAHMVGIEAERRVFLALNWAFALSMLALNLMTGFLYSGVQYFDFGFVPQYSEWGRLSTTWTVLVIGVVLIDFTLQYKKAASGSLRQHRIRAFFLALLWVFPLYLDSVASRGVPMPQLGWLGVFIFIVLMLRAAHRFRVVDITPAFASQRVLDTVGEAILVTDAEGEVRVVNQAAVELLGRSEDVIVGTHADLLIPQLRSLDMEKLLHDSASELAETEFEYSAGAQSRTLAMHVSRLSGEGIECGYVCSLRDVSRQKQVERQLRYESLHDALTGLPNRVAFQAQLEYQLCHQTELQRLAVLFVDLNGFKQINDNHGHRAGDNVLAAAARRLQRVAGDDGLVSRLAGDEFALLLPDGDSAEQVAKEIAEALARPVHTEQGKLSTGASVGIAYADAENSNTALGLLKEADFAMYTAKREGGGFQVFSAQMQAKPARRATLEDALRKAMRNDEMTMWYQPVVDLSGDNACLRMEALLRWQHPGRGIVEAGEFIAVAQNSPMILELGEHALGDVCQFLRSCLRGSNQQPLRVSCNLSELELAEPDLPERFRQTLDYYGVPPESIELEIPESAAAGTHDYNLSRLRQMGVSLWVDDFGRGGASLSRLAQLPVDGIKIDRSLVKQLGSDPAKLAVIKAVVAMARELNLEVIAQGVETPEQSAALEAAGCMLQQGLLFGEATDPATIIAERQSQQRLQSV